MSETAGVWMLLCVGVFMLATGLPAWIVLVAVMLVFSIGGLLTGTLDYQILSALPTRLVGLLEHDLLQALPLYALMGVLLNRLPLARMLYGVGAYLLRATPSAPQLMSLGLGVLLAPINGSVGSSLSMLSRTVQGRLADASVPPPQRAAIICMGSTFSVVIPPSLVLILLGDAMLRAHTEAVNATGMAVRIINTHDIFRGALVPGVLLFLFCMAAAWWGGRRLTRRATESPVAVAAPTLGEGLTAAATFVFLVGLLTGVALGYFFPVEGAALGGMALFVFGIASGTLSPAVLRQVLRETMALCGALIALLVAATMFTLLVRMFGTDRWIAGAIGALDGGAYAALAVVLLLLAIAALVLDAFEIIFVVVPIVMPPLLMYGVDAVWVSVIVLLILQASFLVPPLGYAVMLVRGELIDVVAIRDLARALVPFMLAQATVLVLVLTVPALTQFAAQGRGVAAAVAGPDGEDGWDHWRQQREEAEGEASDLLPQFSD